MANVLADDLDQTVSTEQTPVLTWQFSFGAPNRQTTYEIDLTEANFAKLEDALRPFIDVARAVQHPTPTTRAARSSAAKSSSIETHGFDPKDVRAWAIKNKQQNDNGKAVGERGRLSQSVYDAYLKAQQL